MSGVTYTRHWIEQDYQCSERDGVVLYSYPPRNLLIEGRLVDGEPSIQIYPAHPLGPTDIQHLKTMLDLVLREVAQ